MQTETVTRLRAAVVTDRYGNETLSWANPNELPLETLAPAEPRPSGEPNQDARNAVTSGFTLYLSTDADVTPDDRVRVRGDIYSVIGEPALWLGAGLVVQTERVEG